MAEKKVYKLHTVQFHRGLSLLGRPAMTSLSTTMQDVIIEQRAGGGIIVRSPSSSSYEVVYPEAIAAERYVLVDNG